MKNSYIVASAIALSIVSMDAYSNGCIVVRPTSQLNLGLENDHSDHTGRWEFTTAYRYLFSDRHFRGTHEESHRQEEETDVRNTVHTVDFTLSYQLNQQWRLSASLPVTGAHRSSLYEHDFVSRHVMKAHGIGDMRLMAYRDFTFDETSPWGLNLGIGLKLPTGKDDVKDIAYRPDGPELRNVDQSIQLGDGGTGIIAEMQAFRTLRDEQTFGYFTFSYLLNPRETNGVPTHRRSALEAISSVPDTYQVRAGISRLLDTEIPVTLDLAMRAEGVPAEDLIGGSDGFRRPGYAIYVEPGIAAQFDQHRFTFSLPIAVQRNRVKSVADRASGRHGDAAFADYIFLASYSYAWQ